MTHFSFNPKLSDELALWGEITEPDPKKFKCYIPEDQYEENIRIASKPESPKAKLPVKDMPFPLPKIRLSPKLYEIDPLIKHTIQLNQYSRTVTNLLHVISTTKQNPKCPDIPEIIEIKPSLAQLIDNRAKFELGQSEGFQKLEKSTVLALLKRSCLVVLAHSGFDRASKSSVDVLVDALSTFLVRLGKILHSFSQKDIRRGRFAEKDKLEKALLCIGLGGIQSLEEHWQKDVIEKRDRALKRAENLNATYERLSHKFIKNEETPEEKVVTEKPPLFTHPFTLLDFDADFAQIMGPSDQIVLPISPSAFERASTSSCQVDSESSMFPG